MIYMMQDKFCTEDSLPTLSYQMPKIVSCPKYFHQTHDPPWKGVKP
jgi:hypothetical protein